MKEEVTVKTCDICKQKVDKFCDEQIYIEHLEIAIHGIGTYPAEPVDICPECNKKIMDYINSLDLSDKSF